MNRIIKYTLGLLFLLAFISVEARNNPKEGDSKRNKEQSSYRDQCQKAKAQIDMQINNVRAKLLTGGDLWWNGSKGKYIVPKPKQGSDAPEISSLFAGGVWIGGLDKGGNLKLAASTYPNSSSIDYYTGPLDPETGETEKQICQNWDRFFEVKGEEIEIHINNFNNEGFDCNSVPDGVKYWPAKGNPYFTEKYPFALPKTGQGLAGFHDAEPKDGLYDPCQGDYPIIEIRGCPDDKFADDMFFWVYNDKGGPHTETFGKPIQMEVQVQAFEFVSNDEINDMSFYRYKLINRASEDISKTYFAMWIDPDLGCSIDDYIGSDTTRVERVNRMTGETEMVGRDLMYVYNEDAADGFPGTSCDQGVPTYGENVPILGVDYFRGPLRPFSWKEGELVATELGQTADTLLEIGMSAFAYYNRATPGIPAPTTDPTEADEYYNYLLGLWKDGTAITYGGSGYNIGSTDSTKYTFTSDPSDQTSIGTRPPWSMCSETLPAGDRRTLQVTGPLLLQPGAKNELIIGAVWVTDIDYPCPNLNDLLYADGLAQALFDNCFDRVEGPDAPDMCGIELDKELILVLTNDTTALNNNAHEQYQEVDIFIVNLDGDSLYRFEGYKVFQLKNENVSVQELDDIDNARLVRQVDLKNGVSSIFNWTAITNPGPGNDIWTFKEMVHGADKGLSHTFDIKEDAFAQGDNRLINHKKYHYLVVAYGYNNLGRDPLDIFNSNNPQDGQRKPYIEGVKNIKVLTLTPRPIVYQNLNSFYGDGPEITRISGEGVGSNIVNLKEDMHEAILSDNFNGELTYESGAGPIDVKIYDPLNVKDGKYRLDIIGDFSNFDCGLRDEATWVLTNEKGIKIASEHTLDDFNEQILGDLGITITIGQVPQIGSDEAIEQNNGVLGAEIVYKDDAGVNWFSGQRDTEALPLPFWDYISYAAGTKAKLWDPNGDLTKIGDGFFTPFIMSKYRPGSEFELWFTPGLDGSQNAIYNYSGVEYLNNVDIVMTSNKDKWSRCVVVERGNSRYTATGHGLQETENVSGQFRPRGAPSVGKDGQPDDSNTFGMGWFPGYAVDVETGVRLNIFFGENSTYNAENFAKEGMDREPIGADMIFNPSSEFVIPATETEGVFTQWNLITGGQHVIYVTREKYDGCEGIRDKLTQNSPVKKAHGLGLITWQAVPVLPQGVTMNSIEDGLIPNDVTIKMRVSSRYNKENVAIIGSKDCNTLEELPSYTFELVGKAATDIENPEFAGALDEVNIVPNPYYGFSAYEFTQYSSTVKITNVPAKATVTIYSIDGKFIKQFKRDEIGLECEVRNNAGIPEKQIVPDIEWNLKNHKGIPISSGVYLIHISAPDLQSERTIKWFGINRKFDPSGL